MKKMEGLPYKDLTFASALMKDYYNKLNALSDLYTFEPNLKGLEKASTRRSFDHERRTILHKTLGNQYLDIKLNNSQQANLDLLLDENTLSVTTGHQLCLFTGPLYSIYKIVSTIKLAEILNEKIPEKKYVPIFWLASEDHDFEEVNHAHIYGKKVSWDQKPGNAVGRMTLMNIERTIKELFEIIGESQKALDIKMLITKAYSPDKTLTEATRILLNELFQKQGLLILDADDKHLKAQFAPIIKKELEKTNYQKIVDESSEILISKGYKKQVNPRPINLFYIKNGLRQRIEKFGDNYIIDDSRDEYSFDELTLLVEEFPERFSPNAIMRPLYQEFILPNIAYIGGAGELTYWFQLKSGFEYFKIPFPTLLLRNSATLIDSNSQKKMTKLDVSINKIFGDLEELLRLRTEENAGSKLSLGKEKHELLNVFKKIIQKSKDVDPSLAQFSKAEMQRLENSVGVIEKKMLQAEKKNQDISLNQIRSIHKRLFPNEGLQERYNNVLQYLMDEGSGFIDGLLKEFDPLKTDHLIFQMEKNI